MESEDAASERTMTIQYVFEGQVITAHQHPRRNLPGPGYRIRFVGRDPQKTNMPTLCEHFVVERREGDRIFLARDARDAG